MFNSHNAQQWRWKLLLGLSITMVAILTLNYVHALAATPAPTTPGKEARWNEVLAAAKKEGKVIWYESSEEQEMQRLVADFQKRYPEIKLVHVRLRGTDAAARIVLETQAGAPTGDVGFGGGETLFELDKKGMLKEMDWAELKIDPIIVANPKAVWLACSTYGLVYNPKILSDIPKKWEDLLDPKWKGKIGLWIKPAYMDGLTVVWGRDKVLEFARKLASQEPKLYDSTYTLASAVIAGEIPIGWGIYHTTAASIKQGAPIKFVFCDPTPVSPLYSFATKGGKNPNAGKVFMAWLESKEGLMSYEAATLRGNPLLTGTETAAMLKGMRISSWKYEQAEIAANLMKELTAIMERK